MAGSETTTPVSVNDGRAYGMAQGVSDDELTQTAAGTPSGELLRRYWQPVALSVEAIEVPRAVRLLSEHSEERLSSSDRGVSMVRRQFKEQGNYIIDDDTDLLSVPLAETLD